MQRYWRGRKKKTEEIFSKPFFTYLLSEEDLTHSQREQYQVVHCVECVCTVLYMYNVCTLQFCMKNNFFLSIFKFELFLLRDVKWRALSHNVLIDIRTSVAVAATAVGHSESVVVYISDLTNREFKCIIFRSE